MLASKKTRRGVIGAVVLAGALVFSGFTLTAAGTTPATKASDGAGAATGYTASAIHYVLEDPDRSQVEGVEFTLDGTPAAGSNIFVSLDGGTSWSASGDCTNTAAAVECDLTASVAVTAVTNLRIVVTD